MIVPTSFLPDQTGGAVPGCVVGRSAQAGEAAMLEPISPIDGAPTLPITCCSEAQVHAVIAQAADSFRSWRTTPAPRRGELVRRIGDLARTHKAELAELVSIESGKIRAEAEGEIQEWIDVCEFAVGLSRQLYGNTIASERAEHHLIESWQPLGPVGVISAFNFPSAVWAWNAMIALVCGDTIVWKPSEQTPLTALACHEIVCRATDGFEDAPDALSSVVVGDAQTGATLAADGRVPLVSATGSIAMGRKVAQTVGARLGRCLLELGGNNGMIVTPSADLELAVRGIVFAAVGTCGQRCTSLRRLIVHRDVAPELLSRLQKAYATLPIGDPLQPDTLVGPLVSAAARERMQASLQAALDEGGKLLCGGDGVDSGVPAGGVYVQPAIVHMPSQTPVMLEETFAPLMYVIEYDSLDEAIAIHNGVPQGLSSSIFTSDVREAHRFLGPAGSDCGLVGVNIGTSGAEIGGAFGGEKETGGGRESGSDSWKQYMRRSTATINYGNALPLAQGIRFGQ